MRVESLDYLCCPVCNNSFQLDAEEVVGKDVIQGLLKCHQCEISFKINNGIPALVYPESLEDSDSESQEEYDSRARWYDLRNRLALLRMGAWEYALMPNRTMKPIYENLELKPEASFLETGTGTGYALSVIAKIIGREGHLHASDLSLGMLKMAQKRVNAKNICAELVQANASYLPYQNQVFDAVLHIGGWNTFADKKRAMAEMCRVAKPGVKIIIADEGLKQGKEKTWIGRFILRRDRAGLYSMKPPVGLVPKNAENLDVYWILHDIGWVIEFRNG